MKRIYCVPSLIAAGFLPGNAAAAALQSRSDDETGKATLFDIFQLQHKYTLAAHRSHSSHGSHRSHRSSSGGGYAVPSPAPRITVPSPSTGPSRNTQSTPPLSILPGSPATAPKALPGNTEKFKAIVRQVQAALYTYGYYTGAIDGIVGPQTKVAISSMQTDYGLKVTGTVTPEVLNALGIKAE